VQVIALYGSLILLGAIAAARNGDAWKARDRIRQAAPLAARTGECNAYWTAFGPINVAMFAVSVEVEAGEAVEGLRLAERINHDRSPSIERRVAFLVDQAKGYEQRRDFTSALTLLTTAEHEAPEDMQYRLAAHPHRAPCRCKTWPTTRGCRSITSGPAHRTAHLRIGRNLPELTVRVTQR
jgi:hypothetical protein